jgi:uncharacterized protein YcbK (DUF882 family)
MMRKEEPRARTARAHRRVAGPGARRAFGALTLAAAVAGMVAVRGRGPASSSALAAAPVATTTSGGEVTLGLLNDDSLSGRSRKLRARFLVPSPSENFPFLRRLLGEKLAEPGVHAVGDSGEARKPFAFITMLPFSAKVNGRIGRYRIGFWPNERGARLAGKYDNPPGFIPVTPENEGTPISEHFRLRDFLTKDQRNVWPKYLVLDPELVDKLELVLDDLRSRGYDAKRLHVMSGFRTPRYNAEGGDPRGRAGLSRHQYGDAADVWVENGSGRMADLNGDGRVDARDAAIVAESAERVERAHPELVGGIGLYRATSAHGPFVHIDTRGKRARWGRADG